MSVSNKADKNKFQDCCFGLFLNYVMPRGVGAEIVETTRNDVCIVSFLPEITRNDVFEM